MTDRQRRETTIVTGPTATTTSTSAAFTFSASEPAEFECSLDGALFEGCEEGPQPLPGQPWIDHLAIELTPGPHTLRVRAVDEADLFDPTPATYTWTIVAAPQTTIDSGPRRHDRVDTTASIAFSAPVAGSTFECSLDGGAVRRLHVAGRLHRPGARLAPRSRCAAIDEHGHVDLSPAIHSWTIQRAGRDRRRPTRSSRGAAAADRRSTTATFRVSATELGTTFECSLDGASRSAPCAARTTYTELALGPAHLRRCWRPTRPATSSSSPATHTWTILTGDVTPPETFISSAPRAGQHERRSPPSPSAPTEVGRDLRVLARSVRVRRPAPRRRLHRASAPATHQFYVRATDANGNVDPSPAIYEWEVEDVTPPDTQLIEVPADPSGSRPDRASASPAPTTRSSIEGEFVPLTFECRLDSDSESAWTGCEARARTRRAEPAAATPSRCARSTTRATSTRRRPPTPGPSSTSRRRRRRSTPARR